MRYGICSFLGLHSNKYSIRRLPSGSLFSLMINSIHCTFKSIYTAYAKLKIIKNVEKYVVGEWL